MSAYTVGQELTVELLQPGDYIDVTGVSRGKGFTGAMRHDQYNMVVDRKWVEERLATPFSRRCRW